MGCLDGDCLLKVQTNWCIIMIYFTHTVRVAYCEPPGDQKYVYNRDTYFILSELDSIQILSKK